MNPGKFDKTLVLIPARMASTRLPGKPLADIAGLPMIVHAPIPGQEERNCDHLLEQGAALKAIDASALAWRVRDVVAQPEKLVAMANRARRIGRPDAARDVVAAVLGYA